MAEGKPIERIESDCSPLRFWCQCTNHAVGARMARLKPFPKPVVLKKPLRVHIECKTPAGYRWMRQNIREGVPPIGDLDGDVMVVSRLDRFHNMLDAAECKVIKTFDGAKSRRR